MTQKTFLAAILLFALFAGGLLLPGCGNDDDDDDSSDDDDAVDDDDDDNDNGDDDDDDSVAPPPLFQDHPFLTDTSLWFGHTVNADPPRPRKIGEFGVGNGRVFALVGSTLPYHTMRNIIGPDYERDPMFFSDKHFRLEQNGEKVEMVEQWDRRVRKTPITLTQSSYVNGLELHTVDFAPRGGEADDDWSERTIVRILLVRNLGEENHSNLSIRFHSSLGKMQDGVHTEQIDYKHLAVRPAAGPFDEKGQGLMPIGDLAPGESIWLPLVFAFTFDGEDPQDVFDAIGPKPQVETLLDETYSWWTAWYDQAAVVTGPDEKFNDLLESLQVTIKVQQAHTGATCVMSEYTRTWTRDTIGPVRFYAPMGRVEDLKQMLDHYYLAVLIRGNIANSYDSRHETGVWPDPPDWDSLPTMTGRTGAEGPSYLPLMYDEYFRQTGDLDTIEQRYGMLKHALVHQDFRNSCLLPFSGDETFREIMSVSYGYVVGGTTYEDLWLSANSSFLFAAAADVMARFADLLGYAADRDWFVGKAQEVRNCLEQYFWLEEEGYYAAMIDINTLEPIPLPYEDVNTKPLWSGAGSADDPHQVDQILGVMDKIGRPDGTLQSPPSPVYAWLFDLFNLDINEGVMCGMTQGYYLDNLSRIDHPDADKAFEIWKVFSNDSGNVSEAMVRDDYGRFMYLIEPFGFLSDLTSRYRPWEGGIWGAALVHYLTGFEVDTADATVRFAPHLPADWDFVRFTGAPFGPHTLDVAVEDAQSRRTFTLQNGAGAFDLQVRMVVPGQVTGLLLDGANQNLDDFSVNERWGIGSVKIGPIAVEADQTVTVEVDYSESDSGL